ncbi:MAG: hypothetical protein A2149_05480, partial [Candidatus Schekmanbacteria bacterium RBG_16_38_11]
MISKSITLDIKKVFLIFIIFLLLSLFTSTSGSEESRIDKAKALLEKRNFVGVSIMVKEIIETSKEKSEIGLAYKIKGDIKSDVFEYYENALAEYRKALTFPISEDISRDISIKIAVISLKLQKQEKAEKKDYSKEEVRVALARAKELIVTSKGRFRISSLTGGESFTLTNGAKLYVSEKGIIINSKELPVTQVNIEPEKDSLIILNGKALRGRLIVLKDKQELVAINQLNIEEYLYGVLPKEINPDWPVEAMKAQAIASRSYALFNCKINKDKPFDLDATMFSQVYGGVNSENKKSNQAVDQTREKVLTYKDKLVLAYFHSNSGGFLEDSENIWGIDLPYFEETQDQYSNNIPGYNWSYKISLKDICSALNDNGIRVNKVNEIIPTRMSKYGRITKIFIN